MENNRTLPYHEASLEKETGPGSNDSCPSDPSRDGDEENAFGVTRSHSNGHGPERDTSMPPYSIKDLLIRLRAPEPGGDVGPPPDGGWAAWSQSIVCHFVIFNSW
jgi:hypothetical protein